jgi:uncharacterized protein YkuJ
MSTLVFLGAINKQTGDYVYPKIANKKDEYVCPDCNKDLILCQGEIIRPYFRHKVDSVNPCNHYSNPTETQIHKDAKMVMKSLLERKIPMSFVRNCGSCKKNEEFEIPNMTESSKIELEHRFEYNGTKIADVGYIDNDELFCIFEICNTHKTCSENRPEPWFEIDAETLIKLANSCSSQIKIPCIRCEKCDDCIEKELERKLKIRNEVERKSSENESDGYCCLSKPIMEMLIDIICGDDPYKQWSGIYREMLPVYGERIWDGEESSPNVIGWEYANSDMKENIKIGYDICNYCCDTYYNEDLIRDIQNMQLYKYLKRLYVWHGQPRFTFDCYVCLIDTDDMEDKLKRLCEDLFGCNGDEHCAGKDGKPGGYCAVVTWDSVSDSKNEPDNGCCHCNGTGNFAGDPCWFC